MNLEVFVIPVLLATAAPAIHETPSLMVLRHPLTTDEETPSAMSPLRKCLAEGTWVSAASNLSGLEGLLAAAPLLKAASRLAINEQDDVLVDLLVSRKMAGTKTRPLTRKARRI